MSDRYVIGDQFVEVHSGDVCTLVEIKDKYQHVVLFDEGRRLRFHVPYRDFADARQWLPVSKTNV